MFMQYDGDPREIRDAAFMDDRQRIIEC